MGVKILEVLIDPTDITPSVKIKVISASFSHLLDYKVPCDDNTRDDINEDDDI